MEYRLARTEFTVPVPKGYRDHLLALQQTLGARELGFDQAPYFGPTMYYPEEAIKLWEGNRGVEEYAREAFLEEERLNGLSWMDEDDDDADDGSTDGTSNAREVTGSESESAAMRFAGRKCHCADHGPSRCGSQAWRRGNVMSPRGCSFGWGYSSGAGGWGPRDNRRARVDRGSERSNNERRGGARGSSPCPASHDNRRKGSRTTDSSESTICGAEAILEPQSGSGCTYC